MLADTHRHIHLTMVSFVARETTAAVAVEAVLAGCSIQARIRSAFVNVHRAIIACVSATFFHLVSVRYGNELLTSESGLAKAVISSNVVDARARVLARRIPALVPIGLALVARVAILTKTRIRTGRVHQLI